MANYPTSLPSTTPADHAEVLGEVVAIATELGTDPSGSFSTVKARLDADRAHMVTRPGHWNPSAPLGTPAGTAWPIINRAYATPFHVPPNSGITAVAINVTAAGDAGNVVRLGIFNDSGGFPGAVIDQATVAGDATGAKTWTLGATVTWTGLIWVAAAPQGAGAPGSTWLSAINKYLPDAAGNNAAWSVASPGGGIPPIYTPASGAFTDNPSWTMDGTAARFPYVMLRFA